jgi:PAT family beta-lactamase induction signal transducer AmpG
VDAIGWSAFFLTTMVFGIPGLVMLGRFVPLGVREPEFTVEPPRLREPLTGSGLFLRGLAGGLATGVVVFVLAALLAALKTMRDTKTAFDFSAAFWQVARPVAITDWVQLFGIVVFAVFGGLFVAAISAARHGAGGAAVEALAAAE